VKHLKSKADEGSKIVTQYSLCDTVYAKAELSDVGTVNLWLGAGVMLEYTYEEAIELLTKREADAKEELVKVTKVSGGGLQRRGSCSMRGIINHGS